MVVNFLENERHSEEGREIMTNHTSDSPKSNAPLLQLKFFGGPCNGDVK